MVGGQLPCKPVRRISPKPPALTLLIDALRAYVNCRGGGGAGRRGGWGGRGGRAGGTMTASYTPTLTCIGSAMLDWPAQYLRQFRAAAGACGNHSGNKAATPGAESPREGSAVACHSYHTSPNVTDLIAALPSQPPWHDATIVWLPPAAVGLRNAFQVPALASTSASTVYDTAAEAATVTVTVAALVALLPMYPYKAARAGALWSTAKSAKTLEKLSAAPGTHCEWPCCEGNTPQLGGAGRGAGGWGGAGGVGFSAGRKAKMQPSLHSPTGSPSTVSHDEQSGSE